MNFGQGRLILRDGTDVSFEHRILQSEFGSRCQGSLVGDTTRIDPRFFAERLKFVSTGGMTVMLLVTHHGDRHITFIGEVLPDEDYSDAQSPTP